uniref:Ig-like domain-containing protein n=1 Tax=Strix occidentalis caurina TaxID=311401 RepID=A0A8D0EM94_STROC
KMLLFLALLCIPVSFFLVFCTNLPLSQTPEHILAQTNNKTEILCELKEEYAGVYWYRWSHVRQNFEFLIFSNLLGKVTYGTNISQDKFSVHGVSFHTSYSLHINHLHASDNGTYYCSISQSSQLLLGSGTRLGVGKHHSWGSKMFLLPPAIALLWSCLKHCVVPSILGFPREGAQPLMLPCPVHFSSPEVLWMRGWMGALLSSQVLLHPGSSLLFLQVTGAASRPEDIIPHIVGVDLTAGFKPVLHKTD